MAFSPALCLTVILFYCSQQGMAQGKNFNTSACVDEQYTRKSEPRVVHSTCRSKLYLNFRTPHTVLPCAFIEGDVCKDQTSLHHYI